MPLELQRKMKMESGNLPSLLLIQWLKSQTKIGLKKLINYTRKLLKCVLLLILATLKLDINRIQQLNKKA